MKTNLLLPSLALAFIFSALDAAAAQDEPIIVERGPNRTIAREGPFQLIVAPDVAEEPVLDLQAPDGGRFQMSPRWLAFYDSDTRQSTIVAAIKSCVGQLVAPNVIVFPDAFDDIHAPLRITYQSSGVEQEVILLESDPFSLEAATAACLRPNSPGLVLEMWWEVLAWPQVTSLSTNVLGNGLPDVEVSFGETHLAAGKAFLLGDEGDWIPVAQSWTQISQKQFLIAAVRYAEVAPLLARLSEQAARPPGARPALDRLMPGVVIRMRTVASSGLASGKVADASVSSGQGTDTDGDGVSDELEVLLGRNPLVAGVTNDVNHVVNLRLYTPLR